VRIAMVGIRGVPARYGGLETCAEEVGARLAERGHEVFCYCRRGFPHDGLKEHRGIRRIELPRLKAKFTDTYSHTLLCMFHVLRLKPDAILAFNPGISTLCVIPKVFGMKVALNPDGFDWRRRKWNWLAKFFIYASARFSARIVDQLIIDSVTVHDYYSEIFRCKRRPIYIPNGANIESSENPEILRQYGLEKDGYFLFLSRFVPENSCDVVIRAFEGLKTDKNLVMGGGSIDDGKYAARLMATQDKRIIFPGPIYDPLHVKELHCGCYALIHGNQPGGTSLGLLRALGCGACVLTLNTSDNAYAVKGAGITYELSPEDLRRHMQDLLDNPEKVSFIRLRTAGRIREEYLWDMVTDRYEKTLSSLTGLGSQTSGPERPKPEAR